MIENLANIILGNTPSVDSASLIEKNIDKNLAYFSKVVDYGLKTLPTIMEKTESIRDYGNKMFTHGVNVGSRRATMSYHPGAEGGVLRGDWTTTTKSATSIIREDFKTICARAEYAYRTDSVTRRAVNVLANMVVGQGIKPYPSVKLMGSGDMVDGINYQLAADWDRFNDQGVRNGTMNITMYQAQLLKFITMVIYGSVLQNKIKSRPGSILPWAFQILKPTRLDFSKDTFINNNLSEQIVNNIIHGMKLNAYGEAEQYFFEGENFSRNAADIDLTFFPIEAEQYLGISWLVPVLPAIYDRQQLFFDKMKQSRIGARLGMQIPKDMQEGIQGLYTTDTDGNQYVDLDFQGFAASDRDIKPISFTDPIADTFEALVRMEMIEIAIGMGFSYQRLTSDLQGANFTSGRINNIGDIKYFNVLFKQFTKSSSQFDWNRFVEWEAFTGRLLKYGVGYSQYLSDPWYYSQCYWLPKDREEWVDPFKDAQALLLLYKTGQITFQEMCSRSGKNYRSVIKQLKTERAELIDAGLESMLPENVSTSSKQSNSSNQTEETENADAKD
jgi:lambda family phage portal protein